MSIALRDNDKKSEGIIKSIFESDNNLIDYFLEVGISPLEIISNQNIFKSSSISDLNLIINSLSPKLISKFPNIDKKHIRISNSIPLYIFPKKIEISEYYYPPFSFNLIIDNSFYSSVYKKKYITCLKFYEAFSQYRRMFNEYIHELTKETIIDKEDKIYIPKCLIIVSVYPFFNYFTYILENLYKNIYLKNKNDTLVLIDKVIYHLTADLPYIPRATNVPLNLFNETINLENKAINELPLINFNLENLFEVLEPKTIFSALRHIMLERRVIFFSADCNTLTNLIMGFLTLLYPFQYQYQVISNLPKEYYIFIENQCPYIYGINEEYRDTFFKDENLSINKIDILVVDIDKHKRRYFSQSTKKVKFPKQTKNKFKDQLMRIIKKDNIIEKQKLFFDFMIKLFKYYNKCFKEFNISNSMNKNLNDINTYLDINQFIASMNDREKEFYTKFFNTKMFLDYIKKRFFNDDTLSKFDSYYFEECINEHRIKKNFLKILSKESKLFSKDNNMKDYNMVNIEKAVEIKESNCNLKNEEILYFKKEKNKKEALQRGIFIKNVNDSVNLNYYIFPQISNNLSFLLNSDKDKNNKPEKLNEKIEKIYSQLVSDVKIEEKKSLISLMENYLYLSWVILWGMTFWYTDEDEKKYRFKSLVDILQKIDILDIDVIENLIANLKMYQKFKKEHDEDYEKEYEMILIIYKIIIQKQLTPTDNIISIIKEILNDNPKYFINISQNKLEFDLRPNSYDTADTFRKRTLKGKNDKNILSEQVLFFDQDTCSSCECDGTFSLYESTLALKKEESFPNLEFKANCPSCKSLCQLKLKFRFGIELFNNTVTLDRSSQDDEIILYSPRNIKEKLLNKAIKNINKNVRFNVEEFKVDDKILFWNIIWFFKVLNIDISFMLPYSAPKPAKNSMENFFCFCNDNDDENKDGGIDIKENELSKNCNSYQNELIEHATFKIEIIPHVGIINNNKVILNSNNKCDNKLYDNVFMSNFTLTQTDIEKFVINKNIEDKNKYEKNGNEFRFSRFSSVQGIKPKIDESAYREEPFHLEDNDVNIFEEIN